MVDNYIDEVNWTELSQNFISNLFGYSYEVFYCLSTSNDMMWGKNIVTE